MKATHSPPGTQIQQHLWLVMRDEGFHLRDPERDTEGDFDIFEHVLGRVDICDPNNGKAPGAVRGVAAGGPRAPRVRVINAFLGALSKRSCAGRDVSRAWDAAPSADSGSVI